MEKVVAVLWRPEGTPMEAWAEVLLGPLAARLGDLGAAGVQVNVADGAVAGAAVRFSTFERPIEAVVAVWLPTATGSAADAVLAELGVAAERMAAYLVTESVPLAPPPVGPGERTPGFANVALLRRPAHLDRDEWLARWQGDHTQVAIDTQSTFGYVQHVVVRPLTPGAPVVDGIVEELFPIEALHDFHVFFDTGGSDDELGRRMAA
ncbi:MAG: EthD domain-containing protein, partial [Actinobacteria bacterium]|nr:EthD domain-containing protein [Actinomycetota bacterium]